MKAAIIKDMEAMKHSTHEDNRLSCDWQLTVWCLKHVVCSQGNEAIKSNFNISRGSCEFFKTCVFDDRRLVTHSCSSN